MPSRIAARRLTSKPSLPFALRLAMVCRNVLTRGRVAVLRMNPWAAALALWMSWQPCAGQADPHTSRSLAVSENARVEVPITKVQVNECQRQCNMAWEQCYRSCLTNFRAPNTTVVIFPAYGHLRHHGSEIMDDGWFG